MAAFMCEILNNSREKLCQSKAEPSVEHASWDKGKTRLGEQVPVVHRRATDSMARPRPPNVGPWPDGPRFATGTALLRQIRILLRGYWPPRTLQPFSATSVQRSTDDAQSAVAESACLPARRIQRDSRLSEVVFSLCTPCFALSTCCKSCSNRSAS